MAAAMDARGWDEAAYRRGILRERDLSCRTLFRAVFFDHHDDPDPDPNVLLAAAFSDGSLASFSLSSCISSTHAAQQPDAAGLADPVYIVQAHSGPAYDVRFYPDWQQPLLFSCGDDGRILGWSLGDGTRCKAALCHSLCKGIIWNQYLIW